MRKTITMGLVGLLIVCGLATLGCNALGEENAVKAAETGLVAHWNFDEGSGTTVQDTSGNNHDGSIINNAAWTNGMSGQALLFNGTNYVNMGAIPQTFSQMTLSAWIYPSSVEIDSEWIVGSDFYNTDVQFACLDVSTECVFRFVIQTSSGTTDVTIESPSYSFNQWYNVVGVYDGNQAYLYVNGLKIGQKALTGDMALTREWFVNHHTWYGGTSQSTRIHGKIDEVSIYNRALSTSEILSNYNAIINPSTTPPSAPLNLIATTGDKQLTLTWSAPSSDGGSAITNYMIYRGTSSGSQTLLATVGSVLTYADTSVVNGQTYYYKVSAVNSAGEGVKSNEASTTPTSSGVGALPSWLLPVLAIFIVIAVIGAVAFVFMRKKAPKIPPQGSAQLQPQHPYYQQSPQQYPPQQPPQPPGT